MTTSNLPTEDRERTLRLNSAIEKLTLNQAEHNEWKSALPAAQESVRAQMDAGQAERDATIAAAHEKYAELAAGAQAFIQETEQKGMDLEAKGEQLKAKVQACLTEICLKFQEAMGNETPAPKGKAKPMMADIVGRQNATEESEKDLQQADKMWKEYKKVAMPVVKLAVTWDNSTSKVPAKLTANQMEEAAVFHQDSNWANHNGLAIIAVAIPVWAEEMYNISKLMDQWVEVLILEQHVTEARYHLHKAKYGIFRTPQPWYRARASQHQFELQAQLTLNRWKYKAERAKTSEAKNYYQSLVEDYSDLLEKQKNSEEGPLTDPLPALAARQNTGGQHRCPASQMGAETDSAQAALVKHCWETANAPADYNEDCLPSESSETESMTGDEAEPASNAMDMDQDSSYITGKVDQNGLTCA
ncbi:hypothetical protein GGH96_000054 [Coemansia sp. RSA 1972]|nr:hypothetical protein GGH96_000054 [Coemansia sp. RSA 1972]